MQSEPKKYPDMVSTFKTLVKEEVGATIARRMHFAGVTNGEVGGGGGGLHASFTVPLPIWEVERVCVFVCFYVGYIIYTGTYFVSSCLLFLACFSFLFFLTVLFHFRTVLGNEINLH